RELPELAREIGEQLIDNGASDLSDVIEWVLKEADLPDATPGCGDTQRSDRRVYGGSADVAAHADSSGVGSGVFVQPRRHRTRWYPSGSRKVCPHSFQYGFECRTGVPPCSQRRSIRPLGISPSK